MATATTSENEVILKVSAITPPHEVRDGAKFGAIVRGMNREGWQGRPLLVLKTGRGTYRSLTGSHRWAAAKRVGLTGVPCVVVNAAKLAKAGYAAKDFWDDDQNVSILREVGDVEAAELMQAEIDHNLAELA